MRTRTIKHAGQATFERKKTPQTQSAPMAPRSARTTASAAAAQGSRAVAAISESERVTYLSQAARHAKALRTRDG